MTRSERRKKQYEELLRKDSQKITRCCTSKTIYKNCLNCPNCLKSISEDIDIYKCEKWECRNKARKPMNVLFSDTENGREIKTATIMGYLYGDINGKCESLSVMIIEDEL